MFAEIYTKVQRTRPSEDDYFPAFPFGKARIDGRPTNTVRVIPSTEDPSAETCVYLLQPFGTREIRIYDADANLLVFFQDLKKDPPRGVRRR